VKNKGIYILAVLFGVLTCYFIYDYLIQVEKKINTVEVGEVVVASRDIPAKTRLAGDMFRLEAIPREYIHPQAARSLEEVVDCIATTPLMEGEQVLKSRINAPGDGKDGLSYLVPLGKRALTIAVDQVSGIAGMLRPGDRVDVGAVVSIPYSNGEPYGLVVLQDIEVLAVGQKTGDDKSADQYETVTLAVNLEEAEALMLAIQEGRVRLLLRSPVETGKSQVPSVNLSDFLP
jgi:pilus assembly protein CpaB